MVEYLRHPAEASDLAPLQDRIDELARELFPLIGSKQPVLHKDKVLTAGVENLLEHGLGVQPSGWLILRQDAPVVIWEVTATAENKARYLSLATTADVTATILVV